jgi:hypothetical protein
MASTTKSPEGFIADLMDEARERAERMADTYYSEEYFDRLGGPEATIRAEFPAFAWKEFYHGLLPPVRQIDLIYRRGDPYYDDRDLIVGLGKQIRDEIKHARIFSNLAEQLGVEADMATWEAPNHPDGYYDKLVQAGYAGADHEEPHHVAAGFQCSTEISAAFQIQNLADYLEDEYPNVANSLRDIVADEGDHSHAGRLVARRFTTPEDYDPMREHFESKFDSIEAGMKLAFENAGEA